MFKAVHFKELVCGKVYIDNYDRISVTRQAISVKDLKGKVAYIALPGNSGEIRETVNRADESLYCYPKTGMTLYVSKDSKIPRAILRNSDYKITINPDNADYIVVPELADNDVTYRTGSIFVVATNKTDTSQVALYYFCVSIAWSREAESITPELNKKILDNIESYVKSNESDPELEFFSGDYILQERKLYFVKDCVEIEQILEGTIKKKIVLDTHLKLTPPMEITLDALNIWERLDDSRLLAKAIVASNWQEYPCLISTIIEEHSMDYSSDPQLRYVMRSIDYDYFRSHSSFRDAVTVEPKDWNMLQDYIMMKIGLPEDGGFVPRTDNGVRRFARTAVCYKPVKIHEPMLFQEIRAKFKV